MPDWPARWPPSPTVPSTRTPRSSRSSPARSADLDSPAGATQYRIRSTEVSLNGPLARLVRVRPGLASLLRADRGGAGAVRTASRVPRPPAAEGQAGGALGPDPRPAVGGDRVRRGPGPADRRRLLARAHARRDLLGVHRPHARQRRVPRPGRVRQVLAAAAVRHAPLPGPTGFVQRGRDRRARLRRLPPA